jgi:zinc transport system permease protein
MFDTIREMFSYGFLVRAVLVGLPVSLCAALLGVSLVLKRYSMIGDGLSHVGFGTLAAATAMNVTPLYVSIPVVVLTAFLLLRISESSKIKGDAAIALISTSALAVGVVVISMTTGMNTDVCNYMFGSILAMKLSDVKLSLALAGIVLTLFALFYNKIFAVTFDESFARATGARAELYNMLIALLTAVTIVLGMRMMGALLISSLTIFPALTAMRVFKKFSTVTICSAVVSVVCFLAGVIASFAYDTPTGASVVIMNIAAFALFWGIKLVPWRAALRRFRGAVCILLGVAALFAASSCSAPDAETETPGYNALPADAGYYGADEPPPTAPAATHTLTDDELSSLRGGDGVIEIREKLFIAQCNDIYLNPGEYIGRRVRIEGMYYEYAEEGGAIYYSVTRLGPGCCGNDGVAGFEFACDSPPVCEPDDWISVEGVITPYTYDDGYESVIIGDASVTVKTERGAEYVSQ